MSDDKSKFRVLNEKKCARMHEEAVWAYYNLLVELREAPEVSPRDRMKAGERLCRLLGGTPTIDVLIEED